MSMTMRKLASAVAKSEGKASIGQVRKTLSIMANLENRKGGVIAALQRTADLRKGKKKRK